MKNTVIFKSEDRTNANHGFVDSYFTFNFLQDPENNRFGKLIAINQDTVKAGMGFGMHPHKDMEIITIPLEGELEHKDTLGNIGLTKKGDVQVMSAGTRIAHSEYNRSTENKLKLLQIWIEPNKLNVQPRYGQISFEENDNHNKLLQIVSPNKAEQATWIHQNAWFYLGKFDANQETKYVIKDKSNGVFTFVIDGNITVNGNILKAGDGIGLTEIADVEYVFNSNAKILVIEVPM